MNRKTMKAQVLKKVISIKDNREPLVLEELPIPEPGPKQILVKVSACGVCHTELDEIEGRLKCKLPVILGHEVVGRVENLGSNVTKYKGGERVGIAWIFSSCGKCEFCKSGLENLCPEFKGTGCDADGGYAQYMIVPEDSAYLIPERFRDIQAAPLLCAGVIGYRALKLTNLQDKQALGLFGFGASAHIVIQVAKYRFPNSKVFVFTRPGQTDHQNLAKKLGADWVGVTGNDPPENLNCAIDFTPVWKPIVEALRISKPGGRVVINAIRKEDFDKKTLLEIDYATHIWKEKELKSIANVTRKDAEEFLPLAAEIPIKPEVQEFRLEDVNKALTLLKKGKIEGAGVLKID